MKYVKVRDTYNPVRANKTDAGIDFFVPIDITVGEMMSINNNKQTDYQLSKAGLMTAIILKPQQRILIPSGIHCKLPKGHALIAFNKSGIAHKTGLVVGSAVVDEGYEGEIHISLINTSDKTCLIRAGAKVVQFIQTKVNYIMPVEEEIPLLDFYADKKSTRGNGGFGSTNKKATSKKDIPDSVKNLKFDNNEG